MSVEAAEGRLGQTSKDRDVIKDQQCTAASAWAARQMLPAWHLTKVPARPHRLSPARFPTLVEGATSCSSHTGPRTHASPDRRGNELHTLASTMFLTLQLVCPRSPTPQVQRGVWCFPPQTPFACPLCPWPMEASVSGPGCPALCLAWSQAKTHMHTKNMNNVSASRADDQDLQGFYLQGRPESRPQTSDQRLSPVICPARAGASQ